MKYITYQKPKKDIINILSTIVFSIVCLFVAVFIGAMFYCNVALEYYPIKGISMQPLLNANGKDEDYVYMTRNTNNITYNDIIITKRTVGGEERFIIKRVIALGGDNIMIKDTGVLQVGTANNYYAIYIQYGGKGEFVELKEDFIEDKSVYREMYSEFYETGLSNKNFLTDPNGNRYLHIDDDQIFYAGDNRLGSTDCVDYGAMPKVNVQGEVKYIIYANQNRVWQVIKQMLGFYKWK